MYPGSMLPETDYTLARTIADRLKGKFWQVTLGEWWVVIEGVSAQKLVVLTNDPFGVSFTPAELSASLQDLRKKVLSLLVEEGLVYEDGSWAQSFAS